MLRATANGANFTRSQAGYESESLGSKRNHGCGRFAERLWYFGVNSPRGNNFITIYVKYLKLSYVCDDVYGEIVVEIAQGDDRLRPAISTRKARNRRRNVSFRPQPSERGLRRDDMGWK